MSGAARVHPSRLPAARQGGAGLEPRTLAPPSRRLARVSGLERLGAYVLLKALDREGPRDPLPGQFYMLAAADGWGGGAEERPYLPRACSFARARPREDGVELEFLLEAIGPGTQRLAGLHAGEGLALVGPLGIGFRAPREGTGPLLVGGGIGAAPLLCLEDALPGARVLLGYRSAAHAEAAGLFGGEPSLATDDGSRGREALVTQLLEEALEEDDARTVYACGPPPMLEAVRSMCERRGTTAQLALESGMACGFGACFGCVVATTMGYVRLCVDGPVLDAAELAEGWAGGGH